MWYAAGAVLLVSLSVLLYVSGSLRRREATRTLFDPAQVRSVKVDAAGGDALVTTIGAGDPGELVRRASFTVLRPRVRQTLEDGELTIAVHAPRLGGPSRVDQEILLPEASGVDVAMTSTSGDLIGLGLDVPSIEAHTDRGAIELEFDRAPLTIDATSGSGSVTVAVPAGDDYAVDARTTTGTVHIAVPTSAAAGRHIRLRSTNGSLTVLPVNHPGKAAGGAVFRPWESGRNPSSMSA